MRDSTYDSLNTIVKSIEKMAIEGKSSDQIFKELSVIKNYDSLYRTFNQVMPVTLYRYIERRLLTREYFQAKEFGRVNMLIKKKIAKEFEVNIDENKIELDMLQPILDANDYRLPRLVEGELNACRIISRPQTSDNNRLIELCKLRVHFVPVGLRNIVLGEDDDETFRRILDWSSFQETKYKGINEKRKKELRPLRKFYDLDTYNVISNYMVFAPVIGDESFAAMQSNIDDFILNAKLIINPSILDDVKKRELLIISQGESLSDIIPYYGSAEEAVGAVFSFYRMGFLRYREG